MSSSAQREFALAFQKIDKHELVEELKRIIPQLREICDGRIPSQTHNKWWSGTCKTKQTLTLRAHSITCISGETAYELQKVLASFFCTDNMKLFSYTMSVLLPEAVEIMVKNRFKICGEEARRVMFTDTFVPVVHSSTSSSEDEAADLLHRADLLQRRSKKGKGKLQEKQEPELATIVVHMMKQKGTVYVKDGLPVEIAISRTSTYLEVLEKASEALSAGPTDQFSLLTSGGAIIKKESDWTIGCYLKRLHRSTVKLGIAKICSDQSAINPSGSVPLSSGYSSIDVTANSSPAIEISESSSDETRLYSLTKTSKRKVNPHNIDTAKPQKKPRSYQQLPARASRQRTVKPVPTECMEFSAKELAEATKDYCRASLIGRGGFGVVYKGSLRYSVVAIKVLTKEGEAALFGDSNTFQVEVASMSRFRHPNILQLLGYCAKPIALIFEFMTNGSLYQKLHEERSLSLNWKVRHSVLVDACRGIVYLHTAIPPTVHQDIKSANILLDEIYRAKLGDFGFAVELPKVSGGQTMFTSQCMVRSEGYYPSEITLGKYSDRSDVYSFGVVVLETYTGLKAYDSKRRDPKLVEHFEEDMKDADQFETIYDSYLGKPPLLEDTATRYYNVVTACLKKHSNRPSSIEILKLLE